MSAPTEKFEFPGPTPSGAVRVTIKELSALRYLSNDTTIFHLLKKLYSRCEELDKLVEAPLQHRIIDHDTAQAFWRAKHWFVIKPIQISFKRLVAFRGLPEFPLSGKAADIKSSLELHLGNLTDQIRMDLLNDELYSNWALSEDSIKDSAQMYYFTLRIISLIYSSSDIGIANVSSWASAVFERLKLMPAIEVGTLFYHVHHNPTSAIRFAIENKIVNFELSKLDELADQFITTHNTDHGFRYNDIPLLLEHMGKQFTFEEAVSYVLLKTFCSMEEEQSDYPFIQGYAHLRLYRRDMQSLIPACRRTSNGLCVSGDEAEWKLNFVAALPKRTDSV